MAFQPLVPCMDTGPWWVPAAPFFCPVSNTALFQVSAEGKAWDLLRPDGRALQAMDIAPLGL